MSWLRRQMSMEQNEAHVVNVANLLFFVVVQTLFFIFVASRLETKVVLSKGAALLQLRRLLREHPCPQYRQAGCLLDRIVAEARLKNLTHASRDRRDASMANKRLLGRSVLPVAAGLLLALVALLVRGGINRYKHGQPVLTVVGATGLALVATAYVTELLFYVFVVRRRRFLGDYELLQYAVDQTPAQACPSLPFS